MKIIFNGLELISIPKIENIFNIEELSVYNNSINEIDKVIYEMINLKVLNLSFNNIENISSDIKNLKKLRFLDLGFNNFKTIPAVLGHFETFLKRYNNAI